jgi:predicted TIM-barrel fold metal-dependent hydrolase
VSTTIISTDSHVMEPPGLWEGRIERRFAERAPHLVSEDDADWWYADNCRLQSVSGGSQAGVRFEDQSKLALTARMSEVRAGAYDPKAKLADMEIDGIEAEILYPTLGLQLWRLRDAELLSAIQRAYNDWIAEWCASTSRRLTGIACVLPDDPVAGVAELTRAAEMGLKGALIPVSYGESYTYADARYEPLWEAAAGLSMPLSLHVGTNRVPPTPETTGTTGMSEAKFLSTPTRYATAANWAAASICDMVFSGAFERYPALRVVSLEHEIAWALHLVPGMDYVYTQRAQRAGWHRFPDGVLPSDYFRANVSISFQEDALGLQHVDLLGIDGLIWGSDYPHHETTFPHSRAILDEALAGLDPAQCQAILYDNPRRLYNLPS